MTMNASPSLPQPATTAGEPHGSKVFLVASSLFLASSSSLALSRVVITSLPSSSPP
jgi:hypothetical protein